MKLICGDALTELKKLDAGLVQCCVTSPPYWGLRDYGSKPQTWDDDKNCNHEWITESRTGMTGGTACKDVGGWAGGSVGEKTTFNKIETDFCNKCSAWRGSLGLEPTTELYASHIVQIFREVHRVLRDDGTLWLNLGDTYNAASPPGARDKERWPKQSRNDHQPKFRKATKTLKPKDLCMMPARVALALQADGWYLRSDIIWSKPNPMPESATDRPTKAHEHIFLLTKNQKYYYDAEAIKEKCITDENSSAGMTFGSKTGKLNTRDMAHVASDEKVGQKWEYSSTRNRHSVWDIPTQPYPEAHFATFPEQIPKLCILAGTKPHDIVLDPFAGSFTVGKVASELAREFIGIDLSPDYLKMGKKRISQIGLPL